MLIYLILFFSTVEFRLADGSSKDNSDGRLEVKFEGKWGTVSSKGFDHNAATIVCKTLGMR